MMGFNIGWFGYRTNSLAEAGKMFNLLPGDEQMYTFDFRFSGTVINNEWAIIVMNHLNDYFVYSDAIPMKRPLDMVEARISEREMSCSVQFSPNTTGTAGTSTSSWSISYDFARNRFASHGNPPVDADSLYDEAIQHQAQNADVDFVFDIAIEAAQRFTGFRHDDATAFGEPLIWTSMIPHSDAPESIIRLQSEGQ